LDPELKSRLKEALGAAQRSREVLILELSALPESVQPHHVACSHLLRLVDPKSGFAVVYPHPSRVEMYEAEADNLLDVEMQNPSDASKNFPGPGEFVSGSFLILRPELVASVKTRKTEEMTTKRPSKRRRADAAGKGDGSEEEDDGDACVDKDEEVWNKTVLQMESDVENFLPSKQWRCCKSLLYEILHNPAICLLRDGRRVKLHDRPVVVSLIDYLSAATRRDAPTERRAKAQTPEFKGFRHITAALLSYHAPKTLFKNRLVLPGKAETRASPPFNSAENIEEDARALSEKNRELRRKKKEEKKESYDRTKRNLRKRRNFKLGRRRGGRRRKRRRSGTSESQEEENDQSLSTSSAELDFGDLNFSTLN
jgi:hypothetical protein